MTQKVGFWVISQLYMGNLGRISRQYACYLLLHRISGDFGGYMQAICWPFAANLPFTGKLHPFYGPLFYISTAFSNPAITSVNKITETIFCPSPLSQSRKITENGP